MDTPETGDTNRGADRQVAEQASHFGVSEEAVIEVGRYAKQATAQMLSRPFTVMTQGASALGNSALGRTYGFVTTSDGKDLAEELVRNGLARSHGTAAAPPGKSSQTLRAKYDKLEARARRDRVGIYSPDPQRTIARAGKDSPAEQEEESPQEKQSAEPADILPGMPTMRPIHIPGIVIEEPSIYPRGSTPKPKAHTPAPAKSENFININTATKSELETIEGIGPALAERIIQGRPYETLEGLHHVKGIGPTKFEALRKAATVE